MAVGGAARVRIGALLLESGAVTPPDLEAALGAQRGSAARLGQILVRRGWSSPQAIAAAVAAQAGAPLADAAALRVDADRADPRDLEVYLRRRMAPLAGSPARFVAADPAEARAGLAELSVAPERAEIVIAAPDDVANAIGAAFAPQLAERAAVRTPERLSARGWRLRGAAIAAGAIAALGSAAAAPAVAVPALIGALTACNSLSAGLRIAVLARALRPIADPAASPPAPAVDLAARRPPPVVTLLIPLRDERETLPVLFAALEALDWPPELLDVKLLVEDDDPRTRAAIAQIGAPPFAQVLTVPPGAPATKPRALNFGLDFAEGEIVGVYDAEDRPEPDQIRRVVDILRAAPAEVACVQCRLSWYNPRENWLTRCFAIEYAIWFDVLLAGFRDLRLPLPLGGTSVFFRRVTLERLGGWDAHNVTEDADLGMRLARAGLRAEVSASTTFEEAASRPGQWLRQRSRWVKGFMTTWAVHMRRPGRLWRDLGARGALAFHGLFLGAAAAYLGLPLIWAGWALALAGAGPGWMTGAPIWALAVATLVNLAGWLAMVVAAVAATARRRQRWLWPWIPTMLFYWPLGAVAAWIGLVEMVVAPFKWRKTAHGVGRIAARERRLALRLRRDDVDAPGARAS